MVGSFGEWPSIAGGGVAAARRVPIDLAQSSWYSVLGGSSIGYVGRSDGIGLPRSEHASVRLLLRTWHVWWLRSVGNQGGLFCMLPCYVLLVSCVCVLISVSDTHLHFRSDR